MKQIYLEFCRWNTARKMANRLRKSLKNSGKSKADIEANVQGLKNVMKKWLRELP